MYNLIKEQFPHFHIIKASAGTGKTYMLSQRLTAMLSDIGQKNNELRNILAITFTVNASKEMRQRVIGWLKRLALDDQTAYSGMGIPESEKDTLRQKAEALIETILTQYRDLQIKTIDSFLASVFKACALDFGYHEDFRVVINNREYMRSAFDLYLEGIQDEKAPFFTMLDLIDEAEEGFSFLPQDKVFDTVRGLYIKERHHISEFVIKNKDNEWENVKSELKTIVTAIKNTINEQNHKINSRSSLNNMLQDINQGDFTSLFKRGDKTSPILKADEGRDWANKLNSLWQSLLQKRQEALEIYAERYYKPYISVLKKFEKKVEAVKKHKEVIFIEDIPPKIHKEIKDLNIPDVYMKLGGRLYHYFIDEFQDTSPIQYENLRPFIENSLAEGGSLFIVGDTKQAIYGFRDTDYEIMNALIKENPFKSVTEYCVKGLDKNYRSGEVILNYAKEVFEKARDNGYGEYSDSGLYDWKVEVKEENRGKGYVEARIIEVPADAEIPPEREIVLETVNGLIERGYQYSDIAIIAHKNKQVTEVSSWLSDADIPFVSFSSLDIRNRKVVKELLYLLRFLDNPTDNLSFSLFLRGDIFGSLNYKGHVEDFLFDNKTQPFLYKCFQGSYKDIWDKYFEGPFNKVGYLPIYELLCSMIMAFKVSEHFKDEAGAIARLLEIVKDLESEGRNSLREFLDFIELQDEEGDDVSAVFELPIPENVNAIRLMTVHKAKGLGFPVVIYLVYPLRKRADAMKIVETDDGLRVFRITREFKSSRLQEIYDRIEKKDKINDLNSLYVGLTRAMDELYLFGIAYGSKKSSKSENVSDVEGNQPEDKFKKEFPVDLIVEDRFGNKTSGSSSSTTKTSTNEVRLTFKEREIAVVSQELAYEEKRRGEATHLVLSRIYNLNGKTDDEVNALVTEAIQYTKKHYPEIDDKTLQNQIKEFITHEGIRTFFYTQDMEVYTEKEFVDKDGHLLRIDRLLIGKDKIQVIDFKTGHGDKDYSQQIGHYISTLREIYTGKEINGYILYFDKKEAEEIKE